MASNPYVDYGNATADFGFKFDTQGMKLGETKYAYFKKDELLSHVGVVNADLINATKMEITSTKTNGLFGISAYHGTEPKNDMSWVPTSNSVAMKSCDKSLDAQHHHVNIPNANHTNTVNLRPDYAQSEERNQMTNRKAIPWLADMTSANVNAGVFKSKLGDQTRYIVTPGATDESGNVVTKGAMHAYITRNANNPEFAKGQFSAAKAQKTIYNGQEGYVVPEAAYEPMSKMIKDVVTNHSPFKDGFGVALTKLDNQPTSAPMVVRVNLHRTPMTRTQGLLPTVDSGVTENHIRFIVNGGKADNMTEEEITSAAVQVPGFEDVMKKKKIDASEHTIEPVGDDE